MHVIPSFTLANAPTNEIESSSLFSTAYRCNRISGTNDGVCKGCEKQTIPDPFLSVVTLLFTGGRRDKYFVSSRVVYSAFPDSSS